MSAASQPERAQFAEIRWNGHPVSIEYRKIAFERSRAPVLIFLHEGLGSAAAWKHFPDRLCEKAACRGLVYSRPGYGWSTRRSAGERWAPDYLHRQACEVLPRLLESLGIEAEASPVWLFGHSDGGSIALLHAAHFSPRVCGAIVLAPHIKVEDISIAGIERTRAAYLEGDLRQKLAPYHQDPDSAFWGWNQAWLDPEFRNWSIEQEIAAIRCPVLAIQGCADEYGTMEQIKGIQRRVRHARALELPDCGHSPHRDQPELVIGAAQSFMRAATA